MASKPWDARSAGRTKSSAFKTVCLGLGLGLALGYAMMWLGNVPAVRGFVCAKMPGLEVALSCYD